MIHQTTVTLYRVACTCAQLHTETDSRALAESVARGMKEPPGSHPPNTITH